MGHTMEETIEQQCGILWSIPRSSNGAYYGAYHGAAMRHIMEQQWGISWSNNRAYYGTIMGYTIEQ